jgi:hypothetical protein
LAATITAFGGRASSAFGAFTTINAPIFAEDNRVQILSNVYGGTFTPVGPDNLNYTNGSITATRVNDLYQPLVDPAPTIIGGGGPIYDDQVWNGAFTLASAQAVFGDFHQEFGYFDGASGGTYVKLFDVTGIHYDATGEADLSQLSGHTLRWARGGEDRVWSSQIYDNSDQKDHMVTYQISGLQDNKLTWLLMWEDKKVGEIFADFDYNDLVVELKALPRADVPEPTALMPLAFVGLAGLRRKRAGR